MTSNFSQKNLLPPTIKIVIIGGAKVGKSLLAGKFVDPHLIQDRNVDNSVEESYKKNCKVDGEPITLEIIDTPGFDEYSVMRQHHMRLGHGFLLVFSFENRNSFEEVINLHSSILTFKDRTYFPMVLIGNNNKNNDNNDKNNNNNNNVIVNNDNNKLKDGIVTDILYKHTKVSSDEGLEMSRQLGLSYIETNVRSGMNIELAFHELVRTIRNFWTEERKPMEEKNKKKKIFCF